MQIVEKLVTPNYIKVTFARMPRDEISDLNKWCQQRHCGKQINFRSFAFKTEQEFLMFILVWNPTYFNTSNRMK